MSGALRGLFVAQDKDLVDGQRYDSNVCQCCGYTKTSDTALECVCDRTPWYLEADGHVECQMHRLARAGLRVPGASSKPKWFGGRK